MCQNPFDKAFPGGQGTADTAKETKANGSFATDAWDGWDGKKGINPERFSGLKGQTAERIFPGR
jgi:hypothetical protein